jgi:excisionase family DNA binding protein
LILGSEQLVSIGEASAILGVSEAALRIWTDEGKVNAFVTPGGHRRYSKAELKKLMASHQKMPGIKDLVTELKDTVHLHGEISRSFLNTAWYRQLSVESQTSLANLGRRLLSLIINYISEPAKRDEIIVLTREVGQSFGVTLANLGFPLTDSVEAFISHRNPIISAATEMLKQRGISTGPVIEVIPMVGKVMDEALVALVAAHQQYQKPLKIHLKGEIRG